MMSLWCNSRSCLSLLVFGVVVTTNAIQAQSSHLQSNGNNSRSCDLECPRNAPCRFGNADFSGRMDILTVGTETHRNGMHCDCPIGWTGILCDKKYETCTNQNGHECYNGGECILGLQDKYGNEQLFCDCSNALGYVGKYCETPFEQKCDSSHSKNEDESDGDGDMFCVNGGECNPDFPESSSQPCFCDEGQEGYHCEYKKNAVPECTLDCQNDGLCFVGATGESERAAQNHRWSLEESEEHMFCRCLQGFGGRLCESPAEQCGNSNDHVCLNGGKCVTTSVQTPGGKDRSQYHCDCAIATNDNNDYFAGKYCEHEATSICSNIDWNLFCTQGGACKSIPMEGCSCRNGTTGYKCEFIFDNSDQDVGTQNDSNSNPNESEDGAKNDNYSYDHNQDNSSSGNSDNKRTTLCAEGYCLNGGYCVTEQIILQDGSYDMKEYCDCSQAYDANSNYAGLYCQYKSTSLCFAENALQGSLDETFCVHHGDCQEDGSCDCPSGWTGQYCELKTLELDQNSVDELDTDIDTGFDGIKFDFDKCGETICYNGGACVQTESLQSNGDLVVDAHCDCSPAFDGKYLYDGMSCEFPSTQICSIPQGSQDLEGSTFCTNHGTCMDDIQLGCNCLPGFFGFACEYESHNNGNDFNDAEEIDEGVQWEVCGYEFCHHGGKCITSIIYNEEIGMLETSYSCDCSTAYNDDTAYLGPSCEYPSTNICVPPKSWEPLSSARFCVNHGICRQDPSEGCDCGDGFTGRFCQFKIELDEINNKDVDVNSDDQDFEVCGDNLICLNGGECVTAIGARESGETFEVRKCGCDSTSSGVEIFAGVSCEHKATSFCATPTQSSFCVNGGKCQENDVCDCDSPWKGIHCELHIDPKDLPSYYDDNVNDLANGGNSLIDCNLKCRNGGTCVQGAKDLEFLHDTIRDVAHLNQTHAEDQFAHCACTSGWIGLTCENKLEVCGEDQHFCLHGSKCIPDTNVDQGYSCDCSQADDITGDNNKIHVFAGDSCQYTDTDICTIGDEYPGQPLYFCVHGGSCNDWVIGNVADPGCTCPDNYTGPHCEVNIAIGKKRASASKIKNVVMIAGTLSALVVVLACAANYIRSRMNGRDAPITTDNDVTVTGMIFSPRRRRRAGFGRSANRKSSISVTGLPSSSCDADPIPLGPVDENDGILNDDNPILVESLPPHDGSKFRGSHFV